MRISGRHESRAWDAESTGEQLPQVVGRNEILILRVLANKTRDVRTERDNPEMMDAGEIERRAGKFCRQAMAFERLRHFGVGKNDSVRKATVGKKGAKAIDDYFETLRLFIVRDGCVVEIHVHELPCGFADFFIPNITERAGRALVDLFDDAAGSRAVHVDPGPSVDVEDFAEALHALAGMNADAGFPNDCNFAVCVGLFGFAHEDLRVTRKVYQGIQKTMESKSREARC